MKKSNDKGPFSHFGLKLDRERLLGFTSIPFDKKLDWLEEANAFLYSIADEATKNKWKLFKERSL